MTILRLADLMNPMPALTASAGGRLAEAASVCLEDQGHIDTEPPVLTVTGLPTRSHRLVPLPVDDAMKACYADPEEATEEGACGVAILLLREAIGFLVVRRSRRGTGYDYGLGTVGHLDLSARLEVSGIRRGTRQAIAQRVRQKERQTRQSDTTQGDLPAYVVVVEFGGPNATVTRR